MRMFDIENAIKEWRRQMTEAGAANFDALNELESHLRADFEAFVTSGKPDAEAFALAAGRLGSTVALRDEFAKVSRKPVLTLGIITLLWMVFVGAQVHAYPYPFLAANMTTLVGNFILMLASGFAMCRVSEEWMRRLTSVREWYFQRAIYLSCLIAALSLLLSFGLETISVIQNPWFFKNFPPVFHVRLAFKLFKWLAVMGVTLAQQSARIPGPVKIFLVLLMGPVAFILMSHRLFFFIDPGVPLSHWIFATVVAIQSAFLLAAASKMFHKPA